MNKKQIILVLLSLSLNLWAQESPPPDSAADAKPDLAYPDKRKKIQLNFSDELINGNVANTDTMLMDNAKSASMKKLIRIRENFNSNMEKSKNEFRSR